jgi:penicillin-binding protein 1A
LRCAPAVVAREQAARARPRSGDAARAGDPYNSALSQGGRRPPRSPPDTAIRAASPRSPRPRWVDILLIALGLPLALALAGALALALVVLLASERLPALDELTDYRPKVPLRVYSADGVLLGEFGEERRSVVRITEVPALMKNAILAAEDSRFFEHRGIDFKGIARAAVSNVLSGGRDQGASTITQQVARNFYLSSEKTYTRKIFEALLALRIEESLTKDQILEIYMNQIFLGKRAYGFAAAARIYFGKTLDQLTPAEAAMLAGLPKAPSLYNPLVNPKRATERQHYILNRMHEIGSLTDAEYEAAMKQPLRYASRGDDPASQAPYAAELARMLAYDLFKDDIYSAGIVVHTTIVAAEQRVANTAIRQGVIEYDRKYGYRGPERFVDLPPEPDRAEAAIERVLDEVPDVDDFQAAVVLDADQRSVRVSRGRGQVVEVSGDGLKFAAGALGERAPAARRLRRGAVVRIAPLKNGWEIVQLPEVQAALVACGTDDGAVRALVGGFDFSRNKFNRVTQAWRQPGSSFKPFIYSAALDKGYTATTVIDDAPFSVDPALTGGQLWEPKNYDGKFDGPMKLRQALALSKNMVSIRVLQGIGPRYAQDYLGRFGFDQEKHPAYLTMALGAGSVTPWQMVGAYSVFANGGYRVEPYLISRITDASGRVLAQASPMRAGEEANRAIDARNAFIMDGLMRGVVRNGTARRALALNRSDLAGKTGTTNDSHDAWFAGYSPTVAAVAWVGYDQPRKLGERETGGGLALPIWMAYMGKALAGVPEQPLAVPEGVVSVDGEYYYAENAPGGSAQRAAPEPAGSR